MKIAALLAWVLSAGAGAYLLAIWLSSGGLRQQATKVTRFPAMLVLGHPTLAVLGLAVWVGFLTTAHIAYAWTAFAVLAVVIFLGFVMLTRWLTGFGGKHARGAEQAFPRRAVLAHGAVAITTLLLVLLSAVTIKS